MNASGRYIIYQMLTSQGRKQEIVKHEPIKEVNKKHETIKLEPLRIGLMSHEVEVKEDAARKKYRKKLG